MNQIIRKIVALLVVATSATTLFGSTLYVTPTGAGNQDGSDWANAFAGIQAAVDAADAAYLADGSLHDILVGDGTYTRVVVTNDFALQVRSQNGAASTIIDGGGTNNCVRCYANWNYQTAPMLWGRVQLSAPGRASGVEKKELNRLSQEQGPPHGFCLLLQGPSSEPSQNLAWR